MSKEKVLQVLATAVEITKMVLVISTNTAIKLFYEGKNEIIKQYVEYNEKNHYRQKETLQKLKALTDKANALKAEAHKKVEHMAEAKKKKDLADNKKTITEKKKDVVDKKSMSEKKKDSTKGSPPKK